MKKVLIEADLFLHLVSPRQKTQKVSISPKQKNPNLGPRGLGCLMCPGCFCFCFVFSSRTGWLGSQWGCGGTNVGGAMEESSLDSGGDPKSSQLRL